jgi:hypothetical protein
MPRDIRQVVPCRVIGIKVRVIHWSRERCVHMLIRIIRKLSGDECQILCIWTP